MPRSWSTSTKKVPVVRNVEASGGNATRHAAQLDGRQAVGSAEFLEHAVDVILNRLLGEIQLGGDLLVGESAANQLNQLLLTAG